MGFYDQGFVLPRLSSVHAAKGWEGRHVRFAVAVTCKKPMTQKLQAARARTGDGIEEVGMKINTDLIVATTIFQRDSAAPLEEQQLFVLEQVRGECSRKVLPASWKL